MKWNNLDVPTLWRFSCHRHISIHTPKWGVPQATTLLGASQKISEEWLLALSCPSVGSLWLHATTRLPLYEFSWKFVVEIFSEIFLPNSSWVKSLTTIRITVRDESHGTVMGSQPVPSNLEGVGATYHPVAPNVIQRCVLIATASTECTEITKFPLRNKPQCHTVSNTLLLLLAELRLPKSGACIDMG